jgi:hypothetical protein
MADDAREKLEAAIREYTAAVTEGDLVTDWFVIAATADMNRADITGYLHAAGGAPYHTCIGLLAVARQRVDDEAYGGDDGD